MVHYDQVCAVNHQTVATPLPSNSHHVFIKLIQELLKSNLLDVRLEKDFAFAVSIILPPIPFAARVIV